MQTYVRTAVVRFAVCTPLYKTRSLGYLAEPLDISAEQGYLNPRVGYLDR